MVSTAAAADQLQIWKRRQQFRVLVGERGDIANIDLLLRAMRLSGAIFAGLRGG